MSHPLAPDGVLLVDKAEGMTSHDVVALVRRKLQVRKSAIAARLSHSDRLALDHYRTGHKGPGFTHE